MSRVLVVGAGSPLGTAVTAALDAAGHLTHGTSLTGRNGTEPFDIADSRAARTLLAGKRPQAVVLLSRPQLPENDVDQAIERGIVHVREFVAACGDAGVRRVLFSSSAAVYGDRGPIPSREDGPTPAPTAYAMLKLRSERAISDAAAEGGLSATSFRIFNLYGAGLSSSLINRLLASRETAESVGMFATDDFVRDYVHVDDAAAILCAEIEGSDAEVVNIGTGVGVGNLELLRLLPDARWHPAGELEAPSMSIADIGRLADLPGIRAPLPLAERLGRLR